MLDCSVIENEFYIIRPVTQEDKTEYMRVHQENSQMAEAFESESFRDLFWKMTLSSMNDVYMVVIRKEDDRIVANCSFQKFNSDVVTIGIDVDIPHQNQGIGTYIVKLLVGFLKLHAPEKSIQIKTQSDNFRCQRMIAKAGGVKCGEEPTDYDRAASVMIPQLEEANLNDNANDLRTLLDSKKGIYVNIYKF